MRHTEAKSNTILNQYLREKRKEGFYCYCELKVARGGTFQFAKIEKGQDEGLPALEKEGLVWKASDEDSRVKPCDCWSTPPLPAYLVIRFADSFYFIRYKHIQEMKQNGEVSISLEKCKEIAEKVFHI